MRRTAPVAAALFSPQDVKRAQLRAKLAETAGRIEAVQAHMRMAKAEVERALSAALGGRRVNVVGQVNNCLA